MSFLVKVKKGDLAQLAVELGLSVTSGMTISVLKNSILAKKDYNEEETKLILNNIVEERQEKERKDAEKERKDAEKERLDAENEARRIAAEEEEKRMQFELEKLRLEAQIHSNQGSPTERTRAPSEKLIQQMRVFDGKEDASQYLAYFEQQAAAASLPKEHWVSHLTNLLPADIVKIIIREPEEKRNNYDHVKSLLLKRYKLTPEKFRQLFVTHQKNADETWRDFFYELQGYFDGWTSGLKIETFDQLRDLIITDQMKKRAPVEFKEFYLDEWVAITSPGDLAEKLEEFEDARKTLRPKSFGNPTKGRYECKGPVRFGKNENHSRRIENARNEGPRPERRFVESYQSGIPEKRRQLNCHHCNAPGHIIRYCPELRRSTESAEVSSTPVQTCLIVPQEGIKATDKTAFTSVQKCSVVPQAGVKTRKITFGKKTIVALVDSGSSISLIREDVSSEIIDKAKISKDSIILSGIGNSVVSTKGSFEQTFVVDDNDYSLVWHVVPKSNLSYEAVVGSDILEQASLNFTSDGVEFIKYEKKALCAQISRLSTAEVEMNHISDTQVKSEPEKSRKLFIGGLNYKSTEESLKNHFEKWGEIVNCVVMRDPHTRKSRGFGFVTYKRVHMVDDAQAARPHRIDGREVESKRAVPREVSRKPEAKLTVNKLYVSGLKDGLGENDLREYFGHYGNIVSVNIVTDRITGKRRDFAFVEFDDHDPVDKIVLQNHNYKGRRLRVKKALSRGEIGSFKMKKKG